MNIETSIGENYHFELHDALLVYQGRRTSFVTRHEVTPSKSAPPVLGPAQPLTVSFIESLVRFIGGNVKPEILPENVVAKGDRMIAWWTPQRRRAIFYKNSEAKAKHLNGKVFPQPPLVWHVGEGSLRIRALFENKRPTADTKLAVAPFWNLSHNGTVCTGSMRRPERFHLGEIWMHDRRGGSVASLDCRDRGKLEPRTTFLRQVSQPQHLTHMAMVRYSVNLEVAMRCAPPLAPPDFAWQRAHEGPELTTALSQSAWAWPLCPAWE